MVPIGPRALGQTNNTWKNSRPNRNFSRAGGNGETRSRRADRSNVIVVVGQNVGSRKNNRSGSKLGGNRRGVLNRLRATIKRSRQEEDASPSAVDFTNQPPPPRGGLNPLNLLSYLNSAPPSPLFNSNIIPVDASVPDVDFPNATHSLQETLPSKPGAVDVYSVPMSLNMKHPTIDLLRQRCRDGGRPGKRKDPFKLGLVVEGGGMRGVVTGGMLMQLHDMGMRDAFDVVYGSSAGAINATYFLTGQPMGLDIYFEDISNDRFMNLKRLFGKDPVMNLEYLVEDVMNNSKPLLWDKVLESPLPLKVVASSLDALEPVILDNFKDKLDLADALMASANVPEIAGPPRTVRGERLVDAAVFEPIPYRTAMRDGCTHVLALCSRPRPAVGMVRKAVKSLLTVAIKQVVLNPPYMRKAWQAEVEDIVRNGGINLDDLLVLTMLEGLRGVEPSMGGDVFAVYPSPDLIIQPTCTDAELLKAGAKEGRRTIQHLCTPIVEERPLWQKLLADYFP